MTRPRLVVLGTLLGVAWSAALRGYMVEIAGPASRVDWVGTFLQILLPGAIIGGLLGWAEWIRRTGGRPHWRWLAAAPALFAIAPMLTPGALALLVTTGLGGGAVAVVLIGTLGGFAVSGRGPRWGRIPAGVVAVALTAGGAIAPLAIADSVARGAWAGVLFATLHVLFALACAIPHRAVAAVADDPGEAGRSAPAP